MTRSLEPNQYSLNHVSQYLIQHAMELGEMQFTDLYMRVLWLRYQHCGRPVATTQVGEEAI